MFLDYHSYHQAANQSSKSTGESVKQINQANQSSESNQVKFKFIVISVNGRSKILFVTNLPLRHRLTLHHRNLRRFPRTSHEDSRYHHQKDSPTATVVRELEDSIFHQSQQPLEERKSVSFGLLL